MKGRKVSALLSIVILVMLIVLMPIKTYASSDKQYTAYLTKNLYLREEAKASSEKIKKLKVTNKIKVLTKVNKKWSKVKTSSGEIGYIQNKDMTKEKPYTAYLAKNLYLREEAKASSEKIEKLYCADKITVLTKVNNKWSKIKTLSGEIGYIQNKDMTKEKPYTAYLAKNLYLREEAKASSEKIEKLYCADKITVLTKVNNKWSKIKTSSGKIGYVQNKDITEKKPYISRKGYVKVVNGLYLRKTKSDSGKKIVKMKPGEVVTIQGKEDGWYKLKTSSGKIGYVRTKYISTKNPEDAKLLATYTTYSKGSPSNRNYNIARACGKVKGTILKPGETFNWFKVVGSCGGQNGYKKATVIVNGEYIQDYGGGVCQVATTLCGCAKNLNIKNIYARPHSGAVSYLNGDGIEAAVSYGSKNFKFTNTTNKTIQIETYSSSGRIIVAAYEVK